MVPKEQNRKRTLKKLQLKWAKIQFIIQGTKKDFDISHDVYISSKGFLILNTPLCLLTHRHNTKPFLFPHPPENCSKVNTDDASNEIVGRKVSMHAQATQGRGKFLFSP